MNGSKHNNCFNSANYAILIIVFIAWMWIYTPHIGGYHPMGHYMHGYKELRGKTIAIDPVCGMEVDEKLTKWVSEYKNKKNYFFSLACKEEFNNKPEKYVRGKNFFINIICFLNW